LYLFLVSVAPLLAGISGGVVDARGGEPLARVRVRLVSADLETATNGEGRFRLDGAPAGAFVLQIETVGYRLVKQVVTLTAGEEQVVEVVLSPETFQRTDTVEVRSCPFGVEDGLGAPAPLTLSGAEVQNLSTLTTERVFPIVPVAGVTLEF